MHALIVIDSRLRWLLCLYQFDLLIFVLVSNESLNDRIVEFYMVCCQTIRDSGLSRSISIERRTQFSQCSSPKFWLKYKLIFTPWYSPQCLHTLKKLCTTLLINMNLSIHSGTSNSYVPLLFLMSRRVEQRWH